MKIINLMPKFFPFVLLLICLSSCVQEKESEQTEQNIFFSLENYFEAEAERLNKEKTVLDKTISINGKTEQQKIEGIDFHKEFSLFSQSDINKLAWADKYQVDTLFYSANVPESIHYTAKEEALKTKEIHLYFKEDQRLDSLQIRSKSETALASNENWLSFKTGKGYHIVTSQENFSGDQTKVEIESVFVTN